jgi:hypothetical protein
VLQEESSGFLGSSLGWAVAIELTVQRHSATRATRIVKPSISTFSEQDRAAMVPAVGYLIFALADLAGAGAF